MTNEEIIKKAIEKAEENGFKTNWHRDSIWTQDEVYGQIHSHNNGLHALIFSHDFAKAFWGDWNTKFFKSFNKPHWQYRLQQMVLKKDPIKYLKQFL